MPFVVPFTPPETTKLPTPVLVTPGMVVVPMVSVAVVAPPKVDWILFSPPVIAREATVWLRAPEAVFVLS